MNSLLVNPAFSPRGFSFLSLLAYSALGLVGMLFSNDLIGQEISDRPKSNFHLNGGFEVDDFEWDSGFNFNPGCDGPINTAILGDNGWIYVGGEFSYCGDVLAQNIAKYHPDDRLWESVGGGFDGPVYSLAFFNGKLVSGGGFSSAIGENLVVPTGPLASWEGESWSPLGLTTLGSVRALMRIGDVLYVGGVFRPKGWTDSVPIARLSLEGWEALVSETAYNVTGQVTDIIEMEGQPVVAASVTRQDPYDRDFLAKWNGFGWETFGTGLNDDVLAVAFDGQNLFASGKFSEAGGVSTSGVAYWNGVVWNRLSCGTPSYQNSVQRALHVHQGDLYIGVFLSIPTTPTVVEKWDGQVCNRVGVLSKSGFSGSVRHFLSHSDSVFVFGSFGYSPVGWVNGAVEYDDQAWKRLGVGLGKGLDGDVNAMVATDSGIYVAGSFSQAGEQDVRNIAFWDGDGWQALEGVSGEGVSNQVSSMSFFQDRLYVGGYFTEAGGVVVNGMAVWDGSDWSGMQPELVSDDGFSIDIFAIYASEDGVYVGGRFTGTETLDSPGLIKWNGESWEYGATVLGNDSSGYVTTIFEHEGTVFVGGNFDSIEGVQAVNIAMRSNDAWVPLGQGIDDSNWPWISAILFDESWLYVGGHFDLAGSVTVNNFAVWDGSEWANGPGGNSGDSSASINVIRKGRGCIFVSYDQIWCMS